MKLILIGLTVGVVDERGELSAMYKGKSENDLGIRTDILNNINKNIGMKMLVRSMSPNVIASDEIGSREDIEAINYVLSSGVKGIFTAHGNSMEDFKLNPIFNEMFELKLFQKVIFLDKKIKGNVNHIYDI